MVNDGRGRLFRRKDGKYLIYLPKDLAEDSMFPFKESDSIFVKVSFKIGDTTKLLVEKWEGPARTAVVKYNKNSHHTSLSSIFYDTKVLMHLQD